MSSHVKRSVELSPTVAIVGAGPSGLAACKAALEEGLQPTIFEQGVGVGGVWRGDSGKVWSSLRTNLSKWTCSFSDAPWPEAAEDFPGSADVVKYLEMFAMQYNLLEHVRQQSCVKNLDIVPGGWRVTWEQMEDAGVRTTSEVFNFVIVAAGIFSVPRSASVPGAESFSGEWIHAGEYRKPVRFAQRRVLVIGAAFSGADIAADLAGTAASVTVATRRPLWYLPRYVGGRPIDHAFYSRAAWERGRGATEEERNQKRHAFFASVVGALPPSIPTPNPNQDLPFVAITDTFVDVCKEGTVVVRDAVVSVSGPSVTFADGHKEDFDVVISATGYLPGLHFIGELLKSVEFDPNDLLQPTILHECVWRPELPALAFVGMYRGPYFAAIELQARWACGVFSGRLSPPVEEEVRAGLEAERRVRNQVPRPQFPHGDYVGMTERLAKLVGVHPTDLLAEDNPLQKLLVDGPLLPFHYRLVGFGAKPQMAETAIRECAAKYPW